MFVDEITVHARAGKGGNGVVRWLRMRHIPLGGPAGGNGGRGGDVYVRAIRDSGLLGKYTGMKEFSAENGESGHGRSRHGKDGKDYTIDVPVGSVVTDLGSGQRLELFDPGAIEKILKGGTGGYGNEYFKSSTNQSPKESTAGKRGEEGDFLIELELVVDVGLVGLPNAGKSTLLNTITNAESKIGEYPFTTLEPHLGDFYGFLIADIPGLISGAAKGKGLGHKFLRHIRRTNMLLHCISCEHEDVLEAYRTVREELGEFDKEVLKKPEWVVLTKTDLVSEEVVEKHIHDLKRLGEHVHPFSMINDIAIKSLKDRLVRALREMLDSGTM